MERLPARPIRAIGHGLLFSLFLSGITPARSQVEPKSFAVELNATVSPSPPEIHLHWSGDPYARRYQILRKSLCAPSWTEMGSAEGSATSFVDRQVIAGQGYEYNVIKEGSLGYTGYGYIYAGMDLPLREQRGRIIVLVESRLSETLSNDLRRFEFDLIGDGWTVVRATAQASDSPPEVKEKIRSLYALNPAETTTLLLFGHIPVPYSGNIAPDEHDNHRGAWPADVYYADLDGTWTDNSVNTSSAERVANWNTPGDGKFDQSELPSPVELQVGRVDLSWLTCFLNKAPSLTEEDLSRLYLEKDHRFRHRIATVEPRALIFDRFGVREPEALSSMAWRNFTPFVGDNIETLGDTEFFQKAAGGSYLWSSVGAGGGYNHADQVGTSDAFALHPANVVFTCFVGSYYGDWDNESAFLRAALGASGTLLTSTYAGKPQWLFHPMALGETIGYSVKITQENGFSGLYLPIAPGNGQVHIALMGDPSLRAHPVDPPRNLRGSTEANALKLAWDPSPAPALIGYNIYRAATPEGPYARVNSSPVTETEWTMPNLATGETCMVRAVALTQSPSGTYRNASQGLFYPDPLEGIVSGAPDPPKNLTIASLTANSVTLRWLAGSVEQDEFIVERKGPGDNGFLEIARLNGLSETCADPTATTPGRYAYRVAARRGGLLSHYSNEAEVSTQPATAEFLYFDRGTQGSWIGRYGRDGYAIPGLAEQPGPGCSLTTSNAFLTHYGATEDPRGLELPTADGRTWNHWVGGTPFVFDLAFEDDRLHQVALYTTAWSRQNTAYSLQIFDAVTGTLLEDRAISNINDGLYAVFAVRRQVKIRITPPQFNVLCEIYGIFVDAVVTGAVAFDPPGGIFNGKTPVALNSPTPGAIIHYTLDGSEPTADSPTYSEPFWLYGSAKVRAVSFKEGAESSPPAEASFFSTVINRADFLGWNDQTQGSWTEKFGTEGYRIAAAPGQELPPYAEMSLHGMTDWIWNDATDDGRALLEDRSAQRRRASGWYAEESMSIELGIYDAKSHAVAFYFLDWDGLGRKQTVEVLEEAGTARQNYAIENFQNGRYLVLNVQGRTQIRITRQAGPNAILSGIFFDPAPPELNTPPPPPLLVPSGFAAGQFSFSIEGQPGKIYCVDESPDLEHWTCMQTNILPSPVFTTSLAGSKRGNIFFRMHYVP